VLLTLAHLHCSCVVQFLSLGTAWHLGRFRAAMGVGPAAAPPILEASARGTPIPAPPHPPLGAGAGATTCFCNVPSNLDRPLSEMAGAPCMAVREAGLRVSPPPQAQARQRQHTDSPAHAVQHCHAVVMLLFT